MIWAFSIRRSPRDWIDGAVSFPAPIEERTVSAKILRPGSARSSTRSRSTPSASSGKARRYW